MAIKTDFYYFPNNGTDFDLRLPFIGDRPKDYQSFAEKDYLTNPSDTPYLTRFLPGYKGVFRGFGGDINLETLSDFRNRPYDPAANQGTFNLSNLIGSRLLDMLNKPTTSGYYAGGFGGKDKIWEDRKFIPSGPSPVSGGSLSDTFRALSEFIDPRVLNDLTTRTAIPELLRNTGNRLTLSGLLNQLGLTNADLSIAAQSAQIREKLIHERKKQAKKQAKEGAIGQIPFGIGDIINAQE